MAAVSEVQARMVSPRREQGHEGGSVCLGAGMGLNIDVISPEEPLRPIARQRLDNIRVLTTPVIALARVAFRVFVGEDRASRLKNGAAHEVSEAIISKPSCWRSTSSWICAATSGSTADRGAFRSIGMCSSYASNQRPRRTASRGRARSVKTKVMPHLLEAERKSVMGEASNAVEDGCIGAPGKAAWRVHPCMI